MIKKKDLAEIERLYLEALKNLDTAAAGFDEGFYTGEASTYETILSLLKPKDKSL